MIIVTLNKGELISYESFIENLDGNFYFYHFSLDGCPEWVDIFKWCNDQLGYVPDTALNPETFGLTLKFDKFPDYLFFKLHYED